MGEKRTDLKVKKGVKKRKKVGKKGKTRRDKRKERKEGKRRTSELGEMLPPGAQGNGRP